MTTRLLTHLPGSRSPEPLFEYVPGLRDSAQSFSRSSAARHTSRQEENLEVGSDVLRDFHWVRDENSDLVRATRLEAARTNSILHSEDFSDAAWNQIFTGSVTVDDAVAPDGTTTADKVEDSDSGNTFLLRQSRSGVVSDDSLDRAYSLFIKKRSSGAPVCRIGFRILGSGGTEPLYAVYLDPVDGSTAEGGNATNTRYGVEDYNSDWWRVWVVGSNNNSGNTDFRAEFRPVVKAAGDVNGNEDTSITGHQHVWGAQLEGVSGGASAPSSYIATQGSAVSRSADDLEIQTSFSLQDLSIYTKHVERGTIAAGNFGRIWHLGDRSNSEPRVEVIENNGEYNLNHANTSASANTRVDPPELDASIGDVVELLAVFEGGGDLVLKRALNGGTVEENRVSNVANNGLSAQKMILGGTSSIAFDANDLISGPLIAPGVRTMDEMRSLAART